MARDFEKAKVESECTQQERPASLRKQGSIVSARPEKENLYMGMQL